MDYFRWRVNRVGVFEVSDFEFVICAYGESPFLEECIRSLEKQTESVKILLVTSTPNVHIETMVERYHLEYKINPNKEGIASDWNFGLQKAEGKIVTLVHQDDIYEPNFVCKILENINKQKLPLIAFTNYGEIRKGNKIIRNKNLKIKRIMLIPLKNLVFQRISFLRRRILSFGNMICCPSVAYVKENLAETIFLPGFRSNVDWQAWEMLSKQKGAFVYCSDILMYHRIHEGSATTEIIADNERTKEDYEMLCKFWPKSIAKIIEHFYKKGEDSNSL